MLLCLQIAMIEEVDGRMTETEMTAGVAVAVVDVTTAVVVVVVEAVAETEW